MPAASELVELLDGDVDLAGALELLDGMDAEVLSMEAGEVDLGWCTDREADWALARLACVDFDGDGSPF